MHFDYSSAPIAPRPDLAEAHRQAWRHIASPGTWWTGAERVAIAAETRLARDCALCAERKGALSPYARPWTEGRHASPGTLPAAAVEAAHRLTTDPARLSRAWLESLTAGAPGVSDGPAGTEGGDVPADPDAITLEQYVELIGIVTQAISVDAFHLALGLPLEELPTPIEGEPSRIRPPGALPEDAWVPMITIENLDEPNRDLYGPVKRTGNVIRALSLVPSEVRQLQELSAAQYLSGPQMMHFDRDFRALSRAQIELVAARVSVLAECFY